MFVLIEAVSPSLKEETPLPSHTPSLSRNLIRAYKLLIALLKTLQIISCSCESAALNMSANLENSEVATGLEKVSFHSNPKERQCQRMLELPHNSTHITC